MNDLIVDLEWQEDDLVVQLVHRYGPKKWTLIAKHLNGRIGKQCRERWHNHLDPNINKSPWTEEEDRLLAQAHDQFGNQWAKIAKLLPGRYRPHSTPFHFTVLFLFNCCFAIWTILVEILYVFFFFFKLVVLFIFFFWGFIQSLFWNSSWGVQVSKFDLFLENSWVGIPDEFNLSKKKSD